MGGVRIPCVLLPVVFLIACGCKPPAPPGKSDDARSLVSSGEPRWVPIGGQARDPAEPAVSIEDGTAGVTVEFELRGFHTRTSSVDGQAYLHLSIPGLGRHGQVGDPALPFQGIYLEIPRGVTPRLEVETGRRVSLGEGYRLMPVQPPQSDCHDRVPPFTLNQDSYQSDRFQPGRPAEIGQLGFIRGRRIAFLQVYPFRYNPVSGELEVYQSLRVRLRYHGLRDPAGEAERTRLAAASFESLASRLVANFRPARVAPPARQRKDGADYLIIADDDFLDCIQPLMSWKQRKGYLTRVVPISEIGNSAGEIVDYLQEAYDTWPVPPVYLLIVGDYGNVTSYPLSGLVSDLPYSLLQGSDYWPDITVGRLSVNSQSSCRTVVDKILRYDHHPEIADWYGHSLVAAYFQDKDGGCRADRWFMETAVHVYHYLKNVVGHGMHTALVAGSSCSTYSYRSDSYPHRPDHPPAVPADVVALFQSGYAATNAIHDAFNSGVGLVQHRDHGATTGWGDPSFWVSDVEDLVNGDRTPIVFSMNCLTGKFNKSGDCFAEALQKHPDGGAVGVVAATEISYSGYNDLLTHGMYTCMFPDYDGTHPASDYSHSMRVAEAMNFAKHYMYTYEGNDSTTRLEFRLFHWFGDPEMEYRPGPPVVLDLTHPVTLPPGTTQFEVGGAPDGALAALVQGESLLGRAFSLDGTAVIPVSGPVELTEPVYLTVTHSSAVPYEVELLTVSDQGILELDKGLVGCQSRVPVSLMDLGLLGRKRYPVLATSTSDPRGVRLVLIENPPDSGVFGGQITLSGGPGLSSDTLLVSDQDTVTVAYKDQDDGTGHSAIASDSATALCKPPAIYGVAVQDLTAESATVCFLTDRPTRASIQWGPYRPFPNESSDPVLGQSHCVGLTGLTQCAEYLFQVRAADELGYVSINNHGGHYFRFTAPHAGQIELFAEYLDSDPGWTTSGDWEFGPPQGLGGDYPDPDRACSGTNVYGNDLSDDGEYPNYASDYHLTTPAIDLTGAAAPLTLSFQRWLNIEQSIYDQAEVQGYDGSGWVTIWQHSGYDLLSTEWQRVEYDISQFEGLENFQLRWTLDSDRGLTFSGWNIDDVIIHGTDPDAQCPGRAPVAMAGPDQTVDPGDPVILDGSSSFDPDNQPITHAWTQVLGPPVILDDPASATPGFTAPNVPEDTPVVFSLTVSDGVLASPPDQTQVTIRAGQISSLEIISADTPIPIPDNDSAGIMSAIPVNQAGQVFSLEVEVNITHTYIGDLRVRLEAPSGEVVMLHDEEGGSANNIHQTYPVPELAGENTPGDWKLLVSDHADNDVGTLDDWTLRIWMY